MSAFARFAARAVDALAIATFAGMFGCVIAQVFFRYFLGSPLTWSDELARYLFVWCAFLGWIIAARRRSHLGVDVLATRVAPRAAAVLRLLGALAALGFAAVLAFYGLRVSARNLDVETTTLFFTVGIVYAIVPLAALAVALHAVEDARRAAATLATGSRT